MNYANFCVRSYVSFFFLQNFLQFFIAFLRISELCFDYNLSNAIKMLIFSSIEMWTIASTFKTNFSTIKWKIDWNLLQSMDCTHIRPLYVLSKIFLQPLVCNQLMYHFPKACRTHWSMCSGDYSTASKTVGHHPFCWLFVMIQQQCG